MSAGRLAGADRELPLPARAEDFGGAFIADPENPDSPITLEKFFVDCFGQIYDEAVSADPIAVLAAGNVATPPNPTAICGSDSRLTVVLGRDRGVAGCDLRLVVEIPAGNLVDLSAAGVERAHDKSWDFARIPLPYNGEGAGTWTAAANTLGPHALHAVFELTKNGCKIRREARTTVVVQPELNDCTRSFCPPPRTTVAGASVGVLACARNLCRSADNLEITVTDSRGWLCLVDPNGNHTPTTQANFTDPFPGAGAAGHCFICIGGEQMRVCVPPNANVGEFTVVSHTMRSLGHPNQGPDVCQAHVHVGDIVTGQPEPGHAHVAFAGAFRRTPAAATSDSPWACPGRAM